MKKTSDKTFRLSTRSQSWDSVKPASVFELFELVGVLRVRPCLSEKFSKDDVKRLPSIQQVAYHEDRNYNLIVLLCSNGSLLLKGQEKGKSPVIKQVSWFQNPAKLIRTITLDPSGSWLVCGCMDASLYIVPVAAIVMIDQPQCFSTHWSSEDLSLILQTKGRGLPSSVVWWHTVDDLDIGIIGTELGEILFVDLRLKMTVASAEVKESITSMELMQHKQHETTALLINTVSGDTVQMQLEYKSMRKASFDQMKSTPVSVTTSMAVAMGYERLSKDAIPMDSVFSGMGDLQDKIRPVAVASSSGSTQFSVQYARNQVFIGAHNKLSDILEVYDIDVENHPMFVYQLPPGTLDMSLTDRVIFTVTHQEQSAETLLCVQSSQLAETSLAVPKGHQQKMESSIIQTFLLPPGEKLVAMFQHCEAVESVVNDAEVTSSCGGVMQTVDGVVLVTTSGVYCCQPRISPEKLFLELAVNRKDTSAADILAIASGLDVNKLYEMAGDEALENENYAHALELYHLSKCSFEKRVAQFAKHSRVADILGYLRQVLSKHSDVHTAERKQLSNLTLICFIQQVLNSSGDIIKHSALSDAFSQFLNDNFDYDEVTALEQLAAYGMKNFMFDVAKARGMMEQTLEILAQKGQFHLSTELQTKLASRGFTEIVSTFANGAFIQSMDPNEAVAFLLSKPETILSQVKFLLSHLTSLNEESLVHIAHVLDPSRPSFRSLANKTRPVRKRTASNSSITSMISIESAVSFAQEENKQPALEDLIELFLCSLLVLNHIRDQKLDAPSRAAAIKCIFGGHNVAENDYARKKESAVEFLCRPVRLSCGQQHTAVVNSSGDVYTWGRSQKGRLGHGDLIEEEGKSVPFRVEILHMHKIKVLSVACGMEHTLALCNDGVYSWGSSEYGQLGQGDTRQQTRPVYITELSDKRCIAVVCGHYHSLALSADHRVWSWGWGVHGQLGVGSIEDVLLPTHIKGLDKYEVIQLAAGYSHSVALSVQGQVFTFGGGLYGQLGLGTNCKQTVPQLVESLVNERVYLICCGSFETIAVTEDQEVYNWGRNPHFFRYYMRQDYRSKRPMQTSHPLNSVSHRLVPEKIDCSFSCEVKDVCCGNWHYLALMESGKVYSWGYNDYGQLGLSNKVDLQVTPRLLHTLSNKCIVSISVGADCSVAMDATGSVHVWGRADSGQLGLDFSSIGANRKEVSLPCQLTSLPPLNRRASVSSEHLERFDAYTDMDFEWDLPELSSVGSKSAPYGREALAVALRQLSDHYTAQPLIRHCLDIKDFLAAAVIYETIAEWPQVLGYSLRFLSDCLMSSTSCNELKVKVVSSALEIMHHVIRKFIDPEVGGKQLTQQKVWLLQEILKFWSENNVPTDSLESFLLEYIEILGYPLSLLIIRDPFFSPPSAPDHQEANEGEELSSLFCAAFLNSVITHVVNQLQQENIGEEYNLDLKKILAVHNSTEVSCSQDESLLQQPFAQLDAGVKCKEFDAAQKHMWQEILDNIKKDLDRHPYIALSMTAAATVASAAVSQQQGWREGEMASELQSDVVLFTCNHHFPRVYFQEFILPEFQQRMSELTLQLKHTTKLLLKYYGRVEGCLPTACPICVYNSIRVEQFELLVEQNANGENVLARPWDI
ncbi:uncharacterized protein [Montipora capricornis]|uniref:uncharacterized protein isoform X1 n=1 Tax=Montipora capricornis TaxID=246305 RepID=UPI0035F1B449